MLLYRFFDACAMEHMLLFDVLYLNKNYFLMQIAVSWKVILSTNCMLTYFFMKLFNVLITTKLKIYCNNDSKCILWIMILNYITWNHQKLI